MKKSNLLLIPLVLSFFSLSASASNATAPTSKAEYCANLGKPHAYQRQVESFFNQLAFTNQPGLGLLGRGVCWWHSMFTRNATYFALYQPHLPKPNPQQADRIIDLIYAGRGVVIVPGYANLWEFSYDFANEIAAKLEKSQLTDGALGFGWVRGLAGRSTLRADKLEERMDELFDLVKNQGQIVYQKLQMPGVTAHSWLVTDMAPTRAGYALKVVDSNYPEAQVIRYSRGNTALLYFDDTHFVPYTSRNKDWDKILKLQTEFCQHGKTAQDLREERRRKRN